MAKALPTAPPPSESDTLTCPNCQQEVTYYDITGSYYYGCPHCRQYFAYKNEGPPKKIRVFPTPDFGPVLSLGTEGYLDGRWLRVVGYVYRKDKQGSYYWGEYTLLDRAGNYTMLAEYQGHWTYIDKAPDETYQEYRATVQAYYVDTTERQYRLFNQYQSQTLFVVGEFDWNVLDDDALNVSEYIHPPYVLSHEYTKNQSDWYLGVYKTPEEIATAFGVSMSEMPNRYDVGSNQPSPVDTQWRPLQLFSVITLLVLVGGQLFLGMIKPDKLLFNQSYTTLSDTGKQARPYSFKPLVTASFDVNGPTMLEITLKSRLNNQWAELPTTLVNEQTGKTYSFTKTIEYYNGVDNGKSWTEGSREEKVNLSRIPSGRYHLNFYPRSGNNGYLDILIIVKQVIPLSNVLVIAAPICLYLLIQYLRLRRFEYSRWSNSDFSDI